MFKLVPLQFGCLDEVLPAHITHVRSFITMYSHVILVVRLGGKTLEINTST